MKPPNVLWIFCDQLRWHSLSCSGDPNIETPNLDRLAAEGANFIHAYTSCSVCTPARAAVMTGQHAHANGVRYLGDLLTPDRRTAAHMFRDAGYRTSYVGKWHMASTQNAIGHFEGIDYWVHPLLRGGFEDWFGFELSNHFWRTCYCTDDSMWPPKVIEGYQTDRLTDLSLEYLEGTVRHLDQPWFHVLSVEAPHHGTDDRGEAWTQVGDKRHTRHPAPAEYEARFDPERLILRDNVPEDYEAVSRSQQAQYYAQIANLDDNVGRVLAWLKDAGLAENTVVCFFSDHGERGGSHGLFQKCGPEDESVRIPFFVRWPDRIPPGAVIEPPASLVDVLPTCAGLCGLASPKGIQGFDHSALLRDEPDAPVQETVLIEWFGNPRYHPQGEPGPQWRGVWTSRYTYALSEAGWGVLFDNDADPYQLANRFEDPGLAKVRNDLHARLCNELRRVGEDLPDFVTCHG